VVCSATPGQCTFGYTPSTSQIENGSFQLPTLAAGQTYQIAVTATVTATNGTVMNMATVSAPSGITDPNQGNNTDYDYDTVTPKTADLAIFKTDNTSSIGAGASTTYIVTVTNNGPSSVTGATLSDPAAAGLSKTAVACTATPGQCTFGYTPASSSSKTRPFQLPTLAAGQTYQIAVTATVTATNGTVAKHGHGFRTERHHRLEPGQQHRLRLRHRHRQG